DQRSVLGGIEQAVSREADLRTGNGMAKFHPFTELNGDITSKHTKKETVNRNIHEKKGSAFAFFVP
ncbi:MAG TPA: hypothetical protein VFM69_08505, partial [Pricia sp.]|nr:hypothetical protein [Pricia sp.]